ncbi:MAG: Hint domain-containing protein [Pseudomonadota bacterium]
MADIEGTDQSDKLTGTSGDDIIKGKGGDDQIKADGGDDFVDGGSGQDRINGNSGDDRLEGGDGDDTVRGNGGNDVISGGQGQDRLFGNGGDDVIIGGDGDDTLNGGGGDDVLIGGAGQDMMFGGSGRDTFLQDSADQRSGDVIDGGSGGDDFDTLDLRGLGKFRLVDVSQDADGNSRSGRVEILDENGAARHSFRFREIEKIIPCFTSGSLIATPQGERPIERLREGDKVITRDNGMQEIRWIGQNAVNLSMMQQMHQLRPVRVAAGALGNGLPERDMLLSPNHRVLLMDSDVRMLFDEPEVLSAVKHLVGRPGIETASPRDVTYWHMLFERHEVVLSDGAWSESFQPGDYALHGIGAAQRAEIFALFPQLASRAGIAGFDAARMSLKRYEAQLLRG